MPRPAALEGPGLSSHSAGITLLFMTRRETVLEALQHRQTARCPYALDFEQDSGLEEALDGHYGSSKWRRDVHNYVARCGVVDDGRRVWEPGPPERQDHFGSLWRVDRKPVHLETPILGAASLATYEFPAPELFVTPRWLDETRVKLEEHRDDFTVLYPGFGVFERSWAIRGFENVLMDVAAEPAFFEDLVNSIAEEHTSRILEPLLELDVDGILFGDDWGDQRGVIVGEERWREIFKPIYRRLYRQVHEAGKVVLNHVCGSVVKIIPDLIEIGLDVLESVQVEAVGMDPYALKDRFGDRLSFWGGLGSQSIVPFGSPEEIRAEIRHLVAHMGSEGGYILASSKSLQQGTPVENAAAILEEFMAAG